MCTNLKSALIEYVATEYSRTLKNVMLELHAWGVNHRKQLFGKE
jgi:DNA-binding HxlR family transcriptional regulator